MLDIQNYIGKPKIVIDEVSDTNTIFCVKYLPRWFWHTFWNAIRRAILGYNSWWAITWLKIKWVPHEYDTIDGVKESALDVILNFKKLRFNLDINHEKINWVLHRFSWVWKYDASSLRLPSGIDILNEHEYLFEITDPSIELIVEYRIEKWYSYYSIDFLKKRESTLDSNDIWILLIDNDFKLVEYVKYDIDEHIDDFTWSSKDQLNIDIKTISNKITPKQILSFVWEVLSSYSNLFVFDEAYIDKSLLTEYWDIKDNIINKSSDQDNVKVKPIDVIPLSERTRNALIKNNILYVEDLEKKRRSELLTMKWVWRKAVDEIIVSLNDIWKSLAW